MYEFQKKMKDWEIESLDDPNLDSQFVSEAKEFIKKVEAKELDEEAIKKGDENLTELFESLHEKEDVDSDPIKKEKEKNVKLLEQNEETRKKNLVSQAQIDVSKLTDIETLEKLKAEYKELPEALQVIQGKIDWIKAEQEKKDKKVQEKAVADAEADEAAAEKERLEKIKKDKAAADKEKAEAPTKQMIEGLKKLANMKGYYANYEDLKAIGIEPTGDDMEIQGFKLIRQYTFRVYQIVLPE